MAQLESVAQARYAGGLAAQQDAIRAQVEQTTMRTDLVMIESDKRRAAARLNALVARPGVARPWPSRSASGRCRRRPGSCRRDLEERARRATRSSPRRRPAPGPRERWSSWPISTATRTSPSAWRPTQTGNRIGEWGVMLEVNIPLQQGSRRAKEREARAMLDAANARREAASVGLLGELGENLAALEAARRTRNACRVEPAAAGRAHLPVGTRRLRERQGRLRHPPRRAAPDPARQAGAAQGAGGGAGAPRRHRTHRGRRPMKTGIAVVVGIVVVAAAAGGYVVGTRQAPKRRGRHGRARGRGEEGEEAPLLPQPHGPSRHLAHAQEGPDGHGLRPGVRRRGAGLVGQRAQDIDRPRAEAGRAHAARRAPGARPDRARRRAASRWTSGSSPRSRRSSRATSSACT